ncbi:MAG: Fic family protein [Candidatus Aminicenantes bacterium]|nr:Fic family protein [Candidatus Aminicenantes bacterium]
MARRTGQYRITSTLGEEVRAFVPYPLPPADPPLALDGAAAELEAAAKAALARLAVAGSMVLSIDWFLYGFVRKEAVVTSQIEGTQATLRDVITFEATHRSDRPDDVREVCNYVSALAHARARIADPKGLPLSIRLLREAHRILMAGVRGENLQPGEIRRSQNWIGGSRPGNARFVPPPPEEVPGALGALERWLHQDSDLPPLVRAGLAHVQFETIHPFLDGNGRIGRLLIALLVEHWGLLDLPLLYLSLAFKRNQPEYYARLAAVRSDGDWEGWIRFFLDCVREAADDGVRVARELHALVGRDRDRILGHERATVTAIRLIERLPSRPVVTIAAVSDLLGLTAPPTRKAVALLEGLGVLREITGKRRGRAYSYHEYLRILTDDEPLRRSSPGA